MKGKRLLALTLSVLGVLIISACSHKSEKSQLIILNATHHSLDMIVWHTENESEAINHTSDEGIGIDETVTLSLPDEAFFIEIVDEDGTSYQSQEFQLESDYNWEMVIKEDGENNVIFTVSKAK